MIELPYFEGFTVALLGLGRSGTAAAKSLMASGAELWAWDDNEDARAKAAAAGIPLVDLHKANWDEPVSLVLSPGIPHTHPAPHPVVALARITGTNGKSTTTALIAHILRLSGRRVCTGGNLGRPALDFEPLGADGYYVLEMSSYQLELTLSITFSVAVLLNITPDHLERHGGMDGYIAAKRNIFRRQTKPRTAVISIDDAHCRRIYEELRAAGDQHVRPISVKETAPGGVYVLDGVLYDDFDGQAVPALDLKEVASLPGEHNWQNAAAAYAACRAASIDAPVVIACIRSFAGLAHRQETVAVIDGVRYVNDSKATNADAAARALACYDNIYWIAGGRAKQGGLAGLEPFYPRVAEAFLIGEAASDFAATLDGQVKTHLSGDLASALAAAGEAARRSGRPDAVVLLSPACASFDQFANFEARGEAFRALVEALPGERQPIDTPARRAS